MPLLPRILAASDDFRPLGPAIKKPTVNPAPVFKPVGGRPGIVQGPDGKWSNVAPPPAIPVPDMGDDQAIDWVFPLIEHGKGLREFTALDAL